MTRGVHHRVHAEGRVERGRRRVAQEAARLISEQGIRDYHHAKLKAAHRLGLGDAATLPRNREIDDALREHQHLFHGESQTAALRQLRQAACEAMAFLSPFHPRLVGPVLSGTADRHSAVCLQLFGDAPEAVLTFLDDHGIPFTQTTRRMRMRRDHYRDMPVLQTAADGVNFDLTILPLLARRQAPLDKIDEKPMSRAGVELVRALLG